MAPMLASSGPAPTGSGWSWEAKWDGQRGIARIADAEVLLLSRNLSPITSTYPEIVAALRTATGGGRDVVVDGEIVALDGGRPSFARLQRRMHTPRPRRPLLAEVPAAFYVFDLLEIDGHDTAPLTYLERRQLLGEVVNSAGAVQVTPYWPGADPAAMVAMAAEFGLEGVVAKRSSSVYRRGLRSPSWIKVPLRASAEVIVCGWTGSPTMVRSLLLSALSPSGELVYLGDVGTGFTQRQRREAAVMLTEIEAADHPFTAGTTPHRTGSAHLRWVTPTLVGTIEYREFHRRVRHPSWKGFRTDKTPGEVVWPELDAL